MCLHGVPVASLTINLHIPLVHSAQQAGLEHGVNLQQYVRQQEWVPVLAMGSNASPQQLIRKCRKKYDHDGVKHEDVIIPVSNSVILEQSKRQIHTI